VNIYDVKTYKKITEKWAKLWLEWNSTTTQKARNKANGDIIDVKSCRIFAKNTKMRSDSRQIGETVAGVKLRQQHRKHETGTRKQGRKIENRLEMFVHNGHVRVVTWRVAA
jgi:hypothetical protein